MTRRLAGMDARRTRAGAGRGRIDADSDAGLSWPHSELAHTRTLPWLQRPAALADALFDTPIAGAVAFQRQRER